MARFPVLDAYNFAEDHGFSEETDRIRLYSFPDGYPNFRMTSVRRSHMIELFKKHNLLEEFFSRYWKEGFEESGQKEMREYERRRIKYENLLNQGDSEIFDEDEDDTYSNTFAYESDLQNFLAKNLGIIEEGLTLYKDNRGNGIEYPIDGGRIDLLAKDRDGRFVVIELKLSKGRNKAIGQLLYYMGSIDDTISNGKRCRGILIARELQNDVLTAVKRTEGIELFQYKLQVTVEKVDTNSLNKKQSEHPVDFTSSTSPTPP